MGNDPHSVHKTHVFSETYEYAKELEVTGNSKESAATKAVKEKLFVPNGVFYPTRWEL